MRFLIIILLLFSCSANYHLNKAVKKGAELEQISVPVYLYDTIIDTVENKIFIRTRIKDTIYKQKNVVKYVPKTKWQVRFDNRRFNDSLKWTQRAFRSRLTHVQKIYRDSIQVEKKKLSNERNKSNRLNRFMRSLMVFFIIILLLYIVGRIVASKLLK